ncbi:uncharacterized protein I303_107292 [Kwoniella dejecticola CBS 10117]|uniref:HSF-type DNA-binding domain-containing protein n=1 Tax=Kwoniella dejecticola CBS 10117 TaxID=1296121 RepID=A0A1A5ZZA6_9TREE|nr:uncharacterized protein I303_06695 [Kwoniella dejecticola CBS 10117]OBR83136.1 hypothetical protein I303_06695 [Kwoniella dejecticola CBS 10117]
MPMSDNDRPSHFAETPSKRRLSLRLGPESSDSTSDKKARIEPLHTARPRAAGDPSDELEQPQTGTSTRFTHSSYSSPGSSTEDDRDRSFHDRRSGRLDDTYPSQHRRRPSYPSAWDIGENERGNLSAASSSRQPHRSQLHHSAANTSINASRNSSPPPSSNLSSGQPLVNPPQKTQAAFVGKLYSMLEDEDIAKTGLIYWSAEGTTFTCPNPQEFSKVVLPRFFKHNNWQSFVRQLNMYSFNKVNDIYTTTIDPQAWEFRHSLFRRGEPHLLASIKRKSSRPSAHDGGQPISPTEDMAELAKPVAGWMRDMPGQAGPPSSQPNVLRLASPPQAQRNIVFPYSGPNEDNRPTTTAGLWESRQPSSHGNGPPPMTIRMPPPLSDRPPQPQSQVPRYHPDPSRPPLSAQRFLPPNFSDSPYYPSRSDPVSVESLSNQVIVLEERLQRITEVLNHDRIEHVRYNLDFTSYLLQMVGWAFGQEPLPEMKALHDTLTRQNADMRQKYEDLMASDALAIMASGGGMSNRDRVPEGDRDRGDRRLRYPLDNTVPNSARSVHATLPTPRLPPSANNLSRGATPLVSPSIREFGDTATTQLLSRPPTGFTSTLTGDPYPPSQQQHQQQHLGNVNLPLPLNLTRSSNPNVSYFPTTAHTTSSGGLTPTVNGFTMAKTQTSTSTSMSDAERIEPRRTPREEPKNVIPSTMNAKAKAEDNRSGQVTPPSRKEGDTGTDTRSQEEMKPKAGLRNLLN